MCLFFSDEDMGYIESSLDFKDRTCSAPFPTNIVVSTFPRCIYNTCSSSCIVDKNQLSNLYISQDFYENEDVKA
jgi:hypothetical protein